MEPLLLRRSMEMLTHDRPGSVVGTHKEIVASSNAKRLIDEAASEPYERRGDWNVRDHLGHAIVDA